ncbi:hypothetical protein FKW77_008759 [Venturia effusa]|uniref:Myb-like domain-containing protein n=1 Tax=Venturia effusa TaxID=50376 RepID=A0A517LEE7_9PEZI|nr:hypothetical protein FKW77_008759 [Venturia effusa]
MSFSIKQYDPAAAGPRRWDVKEDACLIQGMEGKAGPMAKYEHAASMIDAFNESRGITSGRAITSIRNRYLRYLKHGLENTSHRDQAIASMTKEEQEGLQQDIPIGTRDVWDSEEDALLIVCKEVKGNKAGSDERCEQAATMINEWNKARGTTHKRQLAGVRNRYSKYLKPGLEDGSKRERALQLIKATDITTYAPIVAKLAEQFPGECNLKSVEQFRKWTEMDKRTPKRAELDLLEGGIYAKYVQFIKDEQATWIEEP